MKPVINLQNEIEASDGEGLSILLGPGMRINMSNGKMKACLRAEIRRHNSTKSGRRNGGEVVMRLIANEGEGYAELLETVVKMWRYGDVPVSQ